jgi:hypothetical protein
VDHAVLDGGKLEDARLCIRRIIDNDWMVPIRSLHDNKVLSWISPQAEEFDEDWNRILFWFSYQLAINWLCSRGLEKDESLYHAFIERGGKEYTNDILRCAIVHIMEPGKVRNLVKGTGEVAWFLTPAAKILQTTLAMLPEHKAGLLDSSHEWMHTKRISAESDESGFIYHPKTGYRRPGILQVFKDWTESTDFISKRVGCAHLGSLMSYIGFPRAYGLMVLRIIREPQPVLEVIDYRYKTNVGTGDTWEVERRRWNGFVSEGYMMGMPVTKPILHLVHTSERQVVKHFLRKRGIAIEDGKKGPKNWDHIVNLPRSLPGNSTKKV